MVQKIFYLPLSSNNKDNISYLEIGVFEGRSFFWMLDNILTGNNTRATAVDPFYFGVEKQFNYNLNLCERKNCVSVYKGISQRILKKFEENSFDIIYIDGSHNAKDVMFDLQLCWNLLKKDGILILDDYLWLHDEAPITLTPKLAIDSFLTMYSDELELLHKDYQVFVRKRVNPLFLQYLLFTNSSFFYIWGINAIFKTNDTTKDYDSIANWMYQWNSYEELMHALTNDSNLDFMLLSDEEKSVIERYLKSLELGQDKPDLSRLTKEDTAIWQELKQKMSSSQ